MISFQLSVLVTVAHCSYLDIYISQKIKLCEGYFKNKFHTRVQASIMNFLMWKFTSIILIFFLFFAGVVKSTAFWTLLLLFQWLVIFKLQFDAKMWLKHFNLFEIAVCNCVQKAVDLTTPAKNRRKMSIIYLNFQIKKFMIILACTMVQNHLHKAWFFVKCKCPNSYSVSCIGLITKTIKTKT